MGPVTLAAAATTSTSNSTNTNVALTVLVAVIGSSLLATLVGSVISGLRESAARRRERYALAVGHLVAWQEFPYRVRRRTSDNPETLAELSAIGHELQEQLAKDRAWIASESRRASAFYDNACELIRKNAGAAAKEAWEATPVTSAAGMNVGNLSPDADLERDRIRYLDRAIGWRFGWKRLVPLPWYVRTKYKLAGTPRSSDVEAAPTSPTT